MQVNVQELINVAAHLGPASEWPGTGEHPESEKTLPLNFAHSPPGNLCHTHVRIHQKKSFNPPQTSTTTKTAVVPHSCVPALDDV